MTTIGDRIRAARRSAGLSQADLARQLGVSRQAVNDIELGRTNFCGLDRLYGLAQFFGVRMEDLIGKPLLTGWRKAG